DRAARRGSVDEIDRVILVNHRAGDAIGLRLGGGGDDGESGRGDKDCASTTHGLFPPRCRPWRHANTGVRLRWGRAVADFGRLGDAAAATPRAEAVNDDAEPAAERAR